MPIRSSVASQPLVQVPGAPQYEHPAVTRKNTAIPVAFQITSPFDRNKVLLPHALTLHVNPSSFQESFVPKTERMQTKGGFVEQHWGDDLGEISSDGTTGAFMNLYTGLSSVWRRHTIAWSKYHDLKDLFRNNGDVHDPNGRVVLKGHVMLIYDRGVYLGSFTKFTMEETEDSPFAFKLSWSFKVEYTVLSVESNFMLRSLFASSPEFQGQNLKPTPGLNNTKTSSNG